MSKPCDCAQVPCGEILSEIAIYRQSTLDEEQQQSSRNFLNASGVRRTWSIAPCACLAIEAISNGRLWRRYRNSHSQKSNRSRDLRKGRKQERASHSNHTSKARVEEKVRGMHARGRPTRIAGLRSHLRFFSFPHEGAAGERSLSLSRARNTPRSANVA
jgi:hypothetical protein